MKEIRVFTLHEERLIAIAGKQGEKFAFGDACQNGRVGNLVAVEVQDGQYRSVADRIEKFIRVPARSKRTGLGFAIADDRGDDEVLIIECRTECVAERVTLARRLRGYCRAFPVRRAKECRRES